jgi:diguanylate cyclase (GGDEF)-like protein
VTEATIRKVRECLEILEQAKQTIPAPGQDAAPWMRALQPVCNFVRSDGGRLAHEIADLLSLTKAGELQRAASWLSEHAAFTYQPLQNGTITANIDMAVGALQEALDVQKNHSEMDRERDPDTRLLSKSEFKEALPRALRVTNDRAQPLSLLMIDLDHFKQVNDTYGHLKGDEVLKETARRIDAVVTGKGEAFRYGGEEMVLILANHTVEEAVAVAERIRLEIESAPISGLQITASLGIAPVANTGTTPDELITLADQAMYDAKRLGRNLVRVFGEPEPIQKPGMVGRKLAQPGPLTEAEADAIRLRHFRGSQPTCPRDDALLLVKEIGSSDSGTPVLLIYCKLCGLNAEV